MPSIVAATSYSSFSTATTRIISISAFKGGVTVLTGLTTISKELPVINLSWVLKRMPAALKLILWPRPLTLVPGLTNSMSHSAFMRENFRLLDVTSIFKNPFVIRE